MDIISKIKNLKKEKNAIILAHCYQPVEIDEVADFVGDSFYLSKVANTTNADIIVFAGVHFMAQSAKLLNPDKKVLLPNINSGCKMADMINLEQLKTLKQQHPDTPAVCYINSTAEIKAECDICCTSSNAIEIVKSLNSNKILFVPDNFLGKWIENKLKNVEVITYNGCCPTHQKITSEDIINARKKYPDAKILAHPECKQEVCNLADFTGSTKEIMEYAKQSKSLQFVIATEKGVVDRLSRDSLLYNWNKSFILIKDDIICEEMKSTSLKNILDVLENENNEIFIEPKIFSKAKSCVENMLDALKVGSL